MTDKELAEGLKAWFEIHKHNRDLRCTVWKVLKEGLRAGDHWKGKPRGDPKAYERLKFSDSWG